MYLKLSTWNNYESMNSDLYAIITPMAGSEGLKSNFEFKYSAEYRPVYKGNQLLGEFLDTDIRDPLGLLQQPVEVTAHENKKARFTFIHFPEEAHLAGVDLVYFLGHARSNFDARAHGYNPDHPNYTTELFVQSAKSAIKADWEFIYGTSVESRKIAEFHRQHFKPYWSELEEREMPGLIEALNAPTSTETHKYLTGFGGNLRTLESKMDWLKSGILETTVFLNGPHIDHKFDDLPLERQQRRLAEVLSEPTTIDISASESKTVETMFGNKYNIDNYGDGTVRLHEGDSWSLFQVIDDGRFIEIDEHIVPSLKAKRPVIGFATLKNSGKRIFIGARSMPNLGPVVAKDESPILGLIAVTYLSGRKDELPDILYGRPMQEAQ
jgi:hypothetical protein